MGEQLSEMLEPFNDQPSFAFMNRPHSLFKLAARNWKAGRESTKPGAAKIYASYDWKEVVINKMKMSRLVIIFCRNRRRSSMELEESFQILDPMKPAQPYGSFIFIKQLLLFYLLLVALSSNNNSSLVHMPNNEVFNFFIFL